MEVILDSLQYQSISPISKSESSFTNTPQSNLNYNRRDSACTWDELLSSKNLEDNGMFRLYISYIYVYINTILYPLK